MFPNSKLGFLSIYCFVKRKYSNLMTSSLTAEKPTLGIKPDGPKLHAITIPEINGDAKNWTLFYSMTPKSCILLIGKLTGKVKYIVNVIQPSCNFQGTCK